MAQRDYEEQPEAPDLGASVQLENDEYLGGPPGDRDALDAGYVPPDRPYALDEDGVTAREMREGETLDERLRREQGDEEIDPDRAGRLVMQGEGAALETSDALDAMDVGIDGGAAPAEEAAVHETDDPELDDEPSLATSAALDDPELDAALADDPLAGKARVEAARDVSADGEIFDPRSIPVAEGGDLSGWGVDPAPARDTAHRDPAAGLDADRETGGAAAPASGRDDAGPITGLP
ncbi:DUF5709 domain-containing protein [Pseudonocardia alaniniphila]|uniref:DUF5709 domain-containing protein n=1 Tax=Pseudonocardia alaniniphila TaxID=75291 RepID=A0ABS9TK08_9PSEU|nr:DUF5709 domain-containing protein [Pseudonocardia alaniniphila]MCH6168886.1 DUF5709 domain-containing protein [Pseudonocardia alaniniphila]